MPKALLIDDEPPARAALRGLLRAHPEITLAGEAGTMVDAQTLLARDDYDLVFLDIQLRGGTGFELVPFVRPAARVIFVTAFDQHALRAFEVNAVDYLVKPVRPERLAESLRRFTGVEPAAPLAALRPDDLVHLKTGAGTTRFVALGAIALVRSCENYSEVLLADGTHYLVRQTMKAWEDRLPSTHFVRVHRESIVGLAHYRGANRLSDETTLLQLAGVPEPVRASFRYVAALRAGLALAGRQM